MTLTESGWKISIKNADGTCDEVTLEPKLSEDTVETVEDVEKDAGDDKLAEDNSNVRVYPFSVSKRRLSSRFEMFTDSSTALKTLIDAPNLPLRPIFPQRYPGNHHSHHHGAHTRKVQ